MWDLIVWAKRTGARLFDFGGITRGTHSDEDPLGGISDFKRYFSRQIVPVREEWVLNHHTRRAAVVAAVHRRLRG
jgi:lipid II:glycine glycyltransferase (peptidoglycan interpeptide bridge formation enzyme)